jgi:hypothetical protein
MTADATFGPARTNGTDRCTDCQAGPGYPCTKECARRQQPAPACRYCGGTGWLTYMDYDDYGYQIPCPEGCPMPELP